MDHVKVVIKSAHEADYQIKKTLVSKRLSDFGINPENVSFEHEGSAQEPWVTSTEIIMPVDTSDKTIRQLKKHLYLIILLRGTTITRASKEES